MTILSSVSSLLIRYDTAIGFVAYACRSMGLPGRVMPMFDQSCIEFEGGRKALTESAAEALMALMPQNNDDSHAETLTTLMQRSTMRGKR